METNQFVLVLVLISLSCLFSFPASTSAASPDASSPAASSTLFYTSEVPSNSPASAPSSSDGFQSFEPFQSQNFGEQLFSIFPNGVDPALQKICGDTDHPIECLTTIAPFLNEKVDINPVSVLKVGLEAMNNKAREALAEATKLFLDPSTPKKVASCLETCIDSYNAVLDSNQKSLDAVSINDIYELSVELSANVENVHDCEDAFDEGHLESPLKEVDTLLGKMNSNNLAIGVDMIRF